MTDNKVESVVAGATDYTGAEILAVYAKSGRQYAVYQTADRVIVQYADAPDIAQSQRKALAPLNPVRGEINGLVDGWRTACKEKAETPKAANDRRAGKETDDTAKAKRYDRRVADALVVALEGDVPSATSLLGKIKSDLIDERTSIAQSWYFVISLASVLAAIAVASLLSCCPLGWLTDGKQTTALWLASGAGAVGAFFSITNGIRHRTVLTNLHMFGNGVDAVLRITIGVIAAPLAICIFASGVVGLNLGSVNFGAAEMTPGTQYSWTLVLVVGFIAGFSERLIPDLLAKASTSVTGKGAAAAPDPGPAAPPAGAGAAPAAGDAANPDDTDACPSDDAVTPEEATADNDLPAATGGVATSG